MMTTIEKVEYLLLNYHAYALDNEGKFHTQGDCIDNFLKAKENDIKDTFSPIVKTHYVTHYIVSLVYRKIVTGVSDQLILKAVHITHATNNTDALGQAIALCILEMKDAGLIMHEVTEV